MARRPLARSVVEDLDDDEEEEEDNDDGAHLPRQQRQQQPAQQPSSSTPSAPALLKYQRRGSSSISLRHDEPSEEQIVVEVGDDKSLRPRFLKERSASHHADLSMGTAADSLTVPQSKAGAFLLSVMAKARGCNFNDMRRVSHDALRGANTNTLSYANRKKEQGVPLRMAASSRRLGAMAGGSSCPLHGEQVDANKADEPQEQRSVATLVRDLSLQKQQIHKQMETLHEIQLRLSEAEHDRPAQARLCKVLVDTSFLREVVSSVREFRFHIGLQINLEIILRKAMSVHAAQERLVASASALLHSIAESKTAANIRAYKEGEAEKAQRHKTVFAEAVAAELALTYKNHPVPGTPVAAGHSAQHYREPKGGAEFERESVSMARTTETGEDDESSFDLAERSRIPSRSGSRLRRALAAETEPPVLGANYCLQFAKKNSALAVAPTTAEASPSMKKSRKFELDSPLFSQLRPVSSPARGVSTCLQLGSDTLAVAAYAGAPLFVEPSPLSKRMANRGTTSAGGTRRRLSFKKKPPLRIPIPIATAASLDGIDAAAKGSSVDHRAPDREWENSATEPASMAQTPSGKNDDSQANKTAGTDDGDEAYEDDFVSVDDDSEPGTSRLDAELKLESDTELIDLLHAIPLQEPNEGTKSSLGLSSVGSTSEESRSESKAAQVTEAATCIQRHPRHHVTPQSKDSATRYQHVKPTPGCDTRARKPESKGKVRQTNCQGECRRQVLQSAHTTAVHVKKPNSAPVSCSRRFDAVKSPTRVPSQNAGASSQQNQDYGVAPDPIKRIQALYSQGLMYHKENQLELAIDSYEAALRIPAAGREFASLYVNLGSAQMTQLKFAKALDSFQHAARIHPTNVKATYNCALALMHLGSASEAEEQFRKVLALDPTHSKALYALNHLGCHSAVSNEGG